MDVATKQYVDNQNLISGTLNFGINEDTGEYILLDKTYPLTAASEIPEDGLYYIKFYYLINNGGRVIYGEADTPNKIVYLRNIINGAYSGTARIVDTFCIIFGDGFPSFKGSMIISLSKQNSTVY